MCVCVYVCVWDQPNYHLKLNQPTDSIPNHHHHRPQATRSRWATAGASKTVPPLLPSRAALAPLYARLDLDEDTATTSSSSTANAKKKKSKAAREEEVIDYRRPKALKEPQQQAATAMASSARQQEQPSELWVLGESLRLVLSRAFLDPFLDPPPIGACSAVGWLGGWVVAFMDGLYQPIDPIPAGLPHHPTSPPQQRTTRS